jgi:hypothetical protein
LVVSRGQLLVAPGFEFVRLIAETVLLSRRFHGFEPMDRLIVATAEEEDSPLIIADAMIGERLLRPSFGIDSPHHVPKSTGSPPHFVC